VLVVTVVERNTIVVNDVWLGLSADAEFGGRARPLTAYGGLDVSETNLAGTGIVLGGATVIADGQAGLRTRFSDPQFLRSAWTLEGQFLYNNAKDFFGNRGVLADDPRQLIAQDYAVVRYQRFGGLVGAGHDAGSVSTQVYLDYRLEKLDAALPKAGSHQRGQDTEPIRYYLADGTGVLSTLRGTLVHDTRDEPVLPTRGAHVVTVFDASLTPLGSDYAYAKLVTRASRWSPLPWGHVLRFEGIAGAIFGDAPLFEKFFVGDFSDLLPDRALELNFDRRPPPNFLDTAIRETRWGDFALRFNAEYRVPMYRGRRTTYGVDAFASAGAFVLADRRDITDPARGYRGLSRVPADLNVNLGLRIDTAAGGFTIGLSNLIGFIPLRREGN
jgi:outer membrane protein assembly factor BamA